MYTFGTDYSGCLGLGDDELNDESDEFRNVFKPIPIPYFNNESIKILKVSCGDSHVVCLTENNEVYTWGHGEFGRLGIPKNMLFIIK